MWPPGTKKLEAPQSDCRLFRSGFGTGQACLKLLFDWCIVDMTGSSSSTLGVFLVVFFRRPELSGFFQSRYDFAVIFFAVQFIDYFLSFFILVFTQVKDGCTILSAYIRTLPVHLGWVVHPKKLHYKSFIADLLAIIGYLDGFSVPCFLIADLLVTGVLYFAADVSHFGFNDSGHLVKVVLHSPETPCR